MSTVYPQTQGQWPPPATSTTHRARSNAGQPESAMRSDSTSTPKSSSLAQAVDVASTKVSKTALRSSTLRVDARNDSDPSARSLAARASNDSPASPAKSTRADRKASLILDRPSSPTLPERRRHRSKSPPAP